MNPSTSTKYLSFPLTNITLPPITMWLTTPSRLPQTYTITGSTAVTTADLVTTRTTLKLSSFSTHANSVSSTWLSSSYFTSVYSSFSYTSNTYSYKTDGLSDTTKLTSLNSLPSLTSKPGNFFDVSIILIDLF